MNCETIEICYAIHDKDGGYTKYLGVSLLSLLYNTSAHIRVHVFSDDTLSEENKAKLTSIADKYNSEICFYKAVIYDKVNDYSFIKYLTIGTLFRLRMPDLLPEVIHKCIYIDADTVIHMDIRELWDMDAKGKIVVARHDLDREHPFFENGLLDRDKYFNAGVMLLDIEKIRNEHDLYEESIDFLKNYPESPFGDQEPLNYLFKDDVLFFDEKYNCFTIEDRKAYKSGNTGRSVEKKAIFHYAGDRPDPTGSLYCDRLFFRYLRLSPWMDEAFDLYKDKIRKLQKLHAAVRSVILARKERKIAVFGVGSIYMDAITEYYPPEILFDNDNSLWGVEIKGVKVSDPDMLKNQKGEMFTIVLSGRYYKDIKMQLEEMSLVENDDFVDGRLLISLLNNDL